MKDKSGFKEVFALNGQPSGYWRAIPYAFTVVMVLLFWMMVMPKAIPSIWEIIAAFPKLIQQQQLLAHWGVRSTQDIGDIVFTLVDMGLLISQPHDSRDDFAEVFAFEDAFEREYPWSTAHV